VTYTPNANYNGSDNFTYTASDGLGGNTVGTVNVAINPVNDPPVANTDPATTNEDTPVIVAVLANDTDADGNALSVTNKTDGAHGTVVINPDNTVTYTPDANYNGSDNFTYTASDGLGGNTVGTVNVTINPVNDPPVAVSDSANTTQDVPVTIPVLVNDTDVENDPLSVTGTTNPVHGTVVINPDNTVTYTPASGYSGADSFGYTISDGHGGTASASVALTVNPPPPPGPATLIDAHFNSGADGFAYSDDAFRGTSQPSYESGSWVSTGGVSGGALDISLGGINNANVSGMSGGFDHGFALSGFTDMVLTFTYNLTQSPHYEPNEFSQVLVSVDGVLYGTNGNAYVDQISGNGNGGPSISTGWVTVTIDLGVLAAGDHTLTIGGYNNHKDSRNESTDLAIDDVNLSTNPGSGTLALDATAPQGASATDSADSGMTLKPGDVLETDHDSSVLGTGTAGNDAPAPSTDYPETVFTPSISDTLTSLVDDQTVQAACAA
jgi:VCBS repeat-containing protein